MRPLCLPTVAFILLVSLLPTAPAGCAIEGEPAPTPGTLYVGCPDTSCNTNTAVVAGSSIAELDEGPMTAAMGAFAEPAPYDETLTQSAAPNQFGVILRHLKKDNVVYRAHVVGDRLFALDSSGNVQLEGAGLVDSVLVVHLLESATDAYVWIEEFQHELPFWISPGPRLIESFRMRWTLVPFLGSTAQPLCPPAEGHDPPTPYDHYAIFFQGDRYDPFTKRVIATGADTGSWFNIACFKSVPSKLHFNRHTRAGAKPRRHASPLDEQTMLKMYVADFCGSGVSYTEVGIPLAWENAPAWQELDLPDPISYEAVWGPEGALCLDQPRRNNADEIAEECDLSPCDEVFPAFPDGWQRSGYIVTANP